MRAAITCCGLLIACLACSRSETAAPAPAQPSAEPPAAPQAALDTLDTRKAVPLLPMMAHHQKQNMRDHLLAVQEIVDGLAKDDFAAVEKASKRLGSSEQMERMCNHMGAGAPGFTPRALEFHRTADTINTAAKERDRGATLRALSSTLGQCNGCHATFKQRVVSAEQWEAASGSKPPQH